MSKEGELSRKQVGAQGCGYGTRTPCYALDVEKKGQRKGQFICLEVTEPMSAFLAGFVKGWTANVGPDGKVRCPLGVFEKSKR